MKTPSSDRCSDGFTRTDLAAVLAVTLLLCFVTLPALGRSGPTSGNLVCMDNLRRLAAAWLMYSDDNHQQLVGNRFGSTAQSGTPGLGIWAQGWLDWTTSSQNTNTSLLVDSDSGSLAHQRPERFARRPPPRPGGRRLHGGQHQRTRPHRRPNLVRWWLLRGLRSYRLPKPCNGSGGRGHQRHLGHLCS